MATTHPDPTPTETADETKVTALRTLFLATPLRERRIFVEWLNQGGADAPVTES